ncbi:glutathione S-transferase C-terminal domain-containing protein homolog [Zootermopsis nevadensis]|uniref:Glutathione S-transferase C-terminal domain-containing protein-like protein n=1 Tax=Zootermopsis nevadensis TaxID=136037 RepID=A0A067R7N4_ZOONE|nr:glutathione S-transferase C-terminal domain-containing protein homolog [Zootermopsis nevadensis]KDR19528.1 Glutathione S-transferase C-terminal domain-containing protein-like protein [Zootermopsis nevadensis]
MDELYVQVLSEPVGGIVAVPLETLVTLFTLKFCRHYSSYLIFVLKPDCKPSFNAKVTDFTFELIKEEDLIDVARICQLPVMIVGDGTTCVAGLCAVLRQVVKDATAQSSGHRCRSLLGFRQGCLMACAESSLWTRFCEVDVINTVKNLMTKDFVPVLVTLPEDVARFEIHMSQSLRIHNIHKQNKDYVNSKGTAHLKLKQGGQSIKEGKHSGNVEIELDHCFAEGPVMTLADVILFPCMHVILRTVRSVYLQPSLPLTLQWYELVKLQDGVEESIDIIMDIPRKIVDDLYVKYILPAVPNQSLYKSDPKRYKPRNRIFTRQADVETSLKMVKELGVMVDWQRYPFGCELEFDWGAMPYEAHPEGGHLPPFRLERKGQQLENLAKAVLKVAKPGHTIVDFCSGSGHLGIILAYMLPRCQLILLENKEESLVRARKRVLKLKLTNVIFCQCNLDYFCGEFDVGVSLHACGVATDLVIQQCISQNAVFICCPCCYGSVQNNHILTYPRSQVFRDSAMTVRDYLVLGHSADQTHDEHNVKTDQGKICMGIIDTDRCLQAKEAGYSVTLAKLIPETCTPKNNLLVGIPKNWQ